MVSEAGWGAETSLPFLPLQLSSGRRMSPQLQGGGERRAPSPLELRQHEAPRAPAAAGLSCRVRGGSSGSSSMGLTKPRSRLLKLEASGLNVLWSGRGFGPPNACELLLPLRFEAEQSGVGPFRRTGGPEALPVARAAP